MRAMLLRKPAPLAERPGPLEAAEVPAPVPAAGELLVQVSVCGVCRTDLDLAEGRLAAPAYPLIPGHQVVGRVAAAGPGAAAFREGDRVGVAWIHSACGRCRWCAAGFENLCPDFRATGCDVDGGYAEFLCVPQAFAHAIPAGLDDAAVVPLLCAGAVGWRALRLANLADGEPLGLTGFGASGHLVLQAARHRYPRSPVYVFARSPGERQFARELGADWAGDTGDAPPQPLMAAIDTTPAWKPGVAALAHLAPGGRLVINAIRKEPQDQDELLRLDYAAHLWREKEIKTVANVTRADVREFLEAASAMRLSATYAEVPLAEANEALAWLRSGEAIRGSRVLRVAS
ncbi:MAG: zinc-binding alcohol dehydrogenase family protein [Gemmatimonadota bacterium]|nr:zinc-binding alcohol dehydrogenase family protein [Gemmatimonadota bacterium]